MSNLESVDRDIAEVPHPEQEKIPSLSALEEDILTVLLGQELYGLQICQAIEDASEGQQTLKLGSLYPSLHRLERKRFVTSRMGNSGIESRGGNRRKYYKITGLGATALTQKQKTRQRLGHWSPSPA
ncbi:MAG: PadR family transcriptional regulator [Cyanobacteria bacterium P01_H01_bin.58]